MPLQKVIQLFSTRKKKSNDLFHKEIEKLLGFSVDNILHYENAFTHPSYSSKKKNANQETEDYERLEFLGDSVLNLIISNYLFDEKQDKAEGYLTQMRSKLVSRNYLNAQGELLNLESLLRKTKEKSVSKNINGNLFEALIGAIYKDKGLQYATQFVQKTILKNIELEKLETKIASYKSFLHEWVQKHKKKLELNTFVEDNAEDLTIFVCVLRINHKVISKGRDTNKKGAEENACRRAYFSLKSKMNG